MYPWVPMPSRVAKAHECQHSCVVWPLNYTKGRANRNDVAGGFFVLERGGKCRAVPMAFVQASVKAHLSEERTRSAMNFGENPEREMECSGYWKGFHINDG